MGAAISSVSSAITTVLTQSIPAPPPGSATALAFQPIGLPVDPADFQSSPLQAVAATDALADVTAKVVDGQYVPTPVSATGLFDLLLSGVVAAAGDAANYGQLRNQALEAYYSGSTDTVTSPGNWWDPATPGQPGECPDRRPRRGAVCQQPAGVLPADRHRGRRSHP